MTSIDRNFTLTSRIERATMIQIALFALSLLACVFSLYNVSRTDAAAKRAEASVEKNKDQIRLLMLQNRNEQNTTLPRLSALEARVKDLEGR